MKADNIYLPYRAEIKQAGDIGADVRHFIVTPGKKVRYRPGQFFMVGVWGKGEAPISVNSVMGTRNRIEFAVRKAGTVTAAVHKLKKGDVMWLRGPFGNGFDTATAVKKDVVFIAGGIGVVPLRPLVCHVLAHKSRFKRLFLLYGAKRPAELLFMKDIRQWEKKGMEVILTVDRADRTWKGNTGVVTGHLDRLSADFRASCAYICGPDIMIENTIKALVLRRMPDRQIMTSLEARMKCGMGKCGQCYQGPEYICTNGPVYTFKEIKRKRVFGP